VGGTRKAYGPGLGKESLYIVYCAYEPPYRGSGTTAITKAPKPIFLFDLGLGLLMMQEQASLLGADGRVSALLLIYPGTSYAAYRLF
jgi:hypothetical protein